jgi:hypothetical protein
MEIQIWKPLNYFLFIQILKDFFHCNILFLNIILTKYFPQILINSIKEQLVLCVMNFVYGKLLLIFQNFSFCNNHKFRKLYSSCSVEICLVPKFKDITYKNFI